MHATFERSRRILLAIWVIAATVGFTGACRAGGGSFQVTRTSAADFFIDPTADPPLLSAYAAYLVTNTSGAAQADVWVRIGGFSGGVVTLDDPQASKYRLGTMSDGAHGTAYFYLTAPTLTTTPQSHVLEVFEGDPDGGGILRSTHAFTLTTVSETQFASANRITGGTALPQPTAWLGDDVTVSLTGETGTLGAGPGGTVPPQQVIFAGPSAYRSWPSDLFKLVRSTVTFRNHQTQAVITTLDDTLATTLADPSNTDYTITYHLKATATTPGPTTVAPIAYINSGQVVKHTNVSTLSTLTTASIPKVENGCTLSASVTPATQAPRGRVTYTVTAHNSGPSPVTLDRFQVALAPGFAPLPGSSAFGGAPVADPTSSGGQLTWSGSFVVPPGGRALAFGATVSDVPGPYPTSAQAVARLLDPPVQIDASADTAVSLPATVALTVSDPGVPVGGPPVVLSFTPAASGPGGTVTVTGSGFSGATAVTIGDAPAASFAVVGDSTITLVTGQGTSGPIVVTTPAGSGTSSAAFTYEVITGSVISGTSGGTASADGTTIELNPFQLRNTGTTVQDMVSATVSIDDPTLFEGATLEATASAGTVTATLPSVGLQNVFVFSSPLRMQPGEAATLRLTLSRSRRLSSAAIALVGLLPLLALRRRTAAVLVAGTFLALTLSGCGSGGSGTSAGGSAPSTVTALTKTTTLGTANVDLTAVVSKGPNQEPVPFPDLPAHLCTIDVVFETSSQ